MDEEVTSSEDEGKSDGNDKSEDDENDVGPSPRKKQKKENLSHIITSRHAVYVPYRNATTQKWNTKTQVSQHYVCLPKRRSYLAPSFPPHF